MLLVDCSACGQRALRGVRSIEGLEHTSAGIILTVRCSWCGQSVRLCTGVDGHPPMPVAC